MTIGITHAEISELGLIRSIARYFYDTKIRARNTNESTVNDQDYFTMEHTIDDLYELAYPELNDFETGLRALPLKYILDFIMTQNVLTDFKETTKRLAAAHFDNEAFVNSSRRILRFRQTSNPMRSYLDQDHHCF